MACRNQDDKLEDDATFNCSKGIRETRPNRKQENYQKQTQQRNHITHAYHDNHHAGYYGRGRPKQEDLREKLNRMRQERDPKIIANLPPPDPPNSFLRDPLRDGEQKYKSNINPNVYNRNQNNSYKNTTRNRRLHNERTPNYREHEDDLKWNSDKTQNHNVSSNHKEHANYVPNTPKTKQTRTNLVQPVNIKVQLSTQTGERSCTVDDTKKLSDIKHVPDKHEPSKVYHKKHLHNKPKCYFNRVEKTVEAHWNKEHSSNSKYKNENKTGNLEKKTLIDEEGGDNIKSTETPGTNDFKEANKRITLDANCQDNNSLQISGDDSKLTRFDQEISKTNDSQMTNQQGYNENNLKTTNGKDSNGDSLKTTNDEAFEKKNLKTNNQESNNICINKQTDPSNNTQHESCDKPEIDSINKPTDSGDIQNHSETCDKPETN